MDIVISILVGFLMIEVYAWLSLFSKWILERAVRRVVPEEQARCREEWNADLDAMPNTMVKLLYALCNFSVSAAESINADFFEANCTDIDRALAELMSRHRAYVEEFRRAKMNRAAQKARFEHVVIDTLSNLNATHSLDDIVDRGARDAIETLAKAFEAFTGTLHQAISLASDLLLVSIDSSTERLDQLEGLLHEACRKRDQLKFNGKARCATGTMAAIRTSLNEDLKAIKDALEDNQWGDDDTLARHGRIIAAVNEAVKVPLLRRP
jgi:hypothetical protein